MEELSDYEEKNDSEILPLNAKDFYKELRLRGYHYKGLFKNVTYANSDGENDTTILARGEKGETT